MEKIAAKIREIARRALENQEIEVILGWEKGDFWYDASPILITEAKETENLIWNPFCVSNLSKYLIQELKSKNKIGVFLKGCDSLAFNQLVKDHRIDKDKVVIYGVPCEGMIDPDKVRAAGLGRGLAEVKREGKELIFVTKQGEKRLAGDPFAYEKCLVCRYPNPLVYDELVGDAVVSERDVKARFAEVEELEALTSEARAAYWAEQFAKCIRCNACRNVCPACSCEKCVFDNPASAVDSKTNIASEAQFFQLTRAYHVAGRCVDCGECSRVCPVGIPLHKLNRKIIKDINELYGSYEAGKDPCIEAPLGTYELEDVDPFDFHRKGGK